MKKINTIISLFLTFFVIIHGVLASLLMLGIMKKPLPIPAFICLGLFVIHIILSIILTLSTVKKAKSSGDVSGIKNKMFIVRRLSGVIMILLLISHLFTYLRPFTGTFPITQLILLLLLIISLVIHIVTNIKPLMESLGLENAKVINILSSILVTVILIFTCIASVIAFLKW